MKKTFLLLVSVVLILALVLSVKYLPKVEAENRAPITWIDDDANEGFYTKMKPFVVEYDIPFTSAVITGRGFGEGFMTLEQMNEMVDLGCEFVSHMHSHDRDYRPADMSEDELHYEFFTSKEIIKNLGFNDNVVVYPFGSTNELVLEIASEYYEVGIDTWDTKNSFGSIVETPFDRYKIQRASAQSEDINEVYKLIDDAVESETWLILCSHVDQGSWYSEERVRNIIEYAKKQGMEFVTVEEGFERMKKFAK